MEVTEDFKLKDVKWRMLSLLDIKEFRKAAGESIAANFEFLSYGGLFDQLSGLEYAEHFSFMLFKEESDHYGLFWNGNLLGHMSFIHSFSPWGAEIIGWVREGLHNKGVGELGLSVAEQIAFNRKNFNFMLLHIDERNLPSRRVAEKKGFAPMLKFPESLGSDSSMILYIKINPKIQKLARQYGRRPVDVMNSPCGLPGMGYFLSSDNLVDFYSWPFPKFHEKISPVDLELFDAYCARVNFSPDVLEAQRNPDE